MRGAFAATAACACLALSSCSGGPTQKNLPWSLVRSSPSQSSVVVQAFGGQCDVIDGARVTRSGDTFAITVRSHCAHSESSGALITTLLRVRLGSTLGTRSIKGACVPGRDTDCDPADVARVPTRLRVVGP